MCARIWNQVANQGQLTVRLLRGCKLCQTERLTIGVLKRSDVPAKQLAGVRTVQGNELSIAGIRAKWIKVSVKESAFSLVEHIECFGLVYLHRGNRLQEHCL